MIRWNTRYLGANMPQSDFLLTIKSLNPDIVGISCTMTTNLPKVASLIQELSRAGSNTKVIVGGYPFNLDKTLWKTLGAHAMAANFESAYQACEQLTEGA